MILVEIKRTDNSEWETRLFNCTWSQFRRMADERFVAIGKSVEFDSAELIKSLRANFNWEDYDDGHYTKKAGK